MPHIRKGLPIALFCGLALLTPVNPAHGAMCGDFNDDGAMRRKSRIYTLNSGGNFPDTEGTRPSLDDCS
jgi:hypothetical protein